MIHRLSPLLALLLLLSSCGAPSPAPPGTVTSPAPDATYTAEPAPPGPPTRAPAPTATFVSPGSAITLTLWTAAELAPDADTEAGALLTVQLGTFEQTHPNVRVQVVRKKAYGTGGLLDFLSSAAPVAPDVLPDLIALDAGQLPAAARAGLIVPLESAVNKDVVDDLYPFAHALGMVDGHLAGLPFTANVQHMAFNLTLVAGAPVTWTEVISSGKRLAFAAGSTSAMDATLADYIVSGGTLLDANGHPHLDSGPLARVLSYYKAAHESGALVDSVVQIESAADAWELYRAGKVAETLVDSSLYLHERAALHTTGVATPPGPNRPGTGIARAWAWAVPARPDPTRKQLAVELLAWLVAPENMGAWSLASNRLPTRRAAFKAWPADDAYAQFMQAYLERAAPQPAAEVEARVGPALYKAVQAVLVNGVSPQVAAAAAAAEVGQ